MRTRHSRLLLPLLLVVLGACSESPTRPVPPAGLFIGRWDGADWRGGAHAVLLRDTLYLVAHRPDPEVFYDEEIRITIPFRGPGAYTVREDEAWLAKITGGDAGYFPPATGLLLIHSFDEASRYLAGELELTARHGGELWRAQGWFHAPVYSRFEDVPLVQRR